MITMIFNLNLVKKDDPVTLRNAIDTLSAIISSLLSLGSEPGIMNAIIIHIVLSKLNKGSKQFYEEQRGYDSLATWEEFHKMMSR